MVGDRIRVTELVLTPFLWGLVHSLESSFPEHSQPCFFCGGLLFDRIASQKIDDSISVASFCLAIFNMSSHS